jgi:hypothetical protein
LTLESRGRLSNLLCACALDASRLFSLANLRLRVRGWQARCRQHGGLEDFKIWNEKEVNMNVQLQQLHIEVEEIPGYLKARFNGAKTAEEAEQQFKLLAEKCKSTKKHKLLLDFTGIPENISLVDRYELGKRTLVFAQHKCKVAAVCKSEHYESACFLATVAQNRWVELCMFTNIEDALEWLLKE